MTIRKLIRLKFGRSMAHFGELGIGMEESNERLHSDTLFSAWFSAYAQLAGARAIASLMDEFNTQPEPPFRLSSTFIYRKVDGTYIDYLPKPAPFPMGYPIGEDFEFAKAYKALKYLPRSVWQRWYQASGFDPNADAAELLAHTKKQAQGALAQAGTFSYNQAFQTHKVPRASLDRRTQAANLYHTGFVQYDWQYLEQDDALSQRHQAIDSLAGLYFLADFSERSSVTPDAFLEVMDFLGDEGIGGERSSGAGQFEVEVSDLPAEWEALLDFEAGNAHSLVSLFWQNPISRSMVQNACYELRERGGWITSPSAGGRQMRRKALQMFIEGSVFPVRPMGALADVTPQGFTRHPIYRSGISFSLPIHVSL
jgi:CRISPR-associated protein Csm4